jgi:uncharacterized repeat protein (TIGR01451 family)
MSTGGPRAHRSRRHRPGGRVRTDIMALLVIGAMAALAATAANAVTKRTNPNPPDKCPSGLQVLQPVTTGSHALTYEAEAGSISLVVRSTSDGPVVDFTTDGPTHLVDRVIVKRGDGAMHFDYRPDGTTSGTGLRAPTNPSTGKNHVPSYLCVATRLKPPPPVDVCPNIPGNQAEIPPGMIKDEAGNCVTPPPTDVCPNIPGNQATIPPGMIKDANGNCVTPPPPPPTDVCPNIPGVQETVPPGMIKDASGNCVTPPPPPTDVCPNIPGVQETIPPGMIKDASGNCVTPPPPPPPPPNVDLTIAKEDSADPISVGRVVQYTITVTNNGPGKATDVVVTDTVPAGLEIVSVRANQGTCSTSGRVITCRLGGLTPRSKAVVKVRARGTVPGSVVNTARVTGDQPDPNPNNNTTSETTRIVAPFQPPEVRCDSVTVGRRTISVGSRTTLRVFVKANGRPLAGERVRVSGAGISVSARTNGRGVAVVSVRAVRPGVVTIRVAGETCARRIGAVDRGQPDLTG